MNLNKIGLLSLCCFASCLVASATELACRVSDQQLADLVAKAPPCPADLAAYGLKLKLIDYIDCTNPDDPHEFMDQGTSKVVNGPAGRYRITAAHRHAFFAYRHRAPGADTPFLMIVEYPDDADRNITVMTHDSTRPKQSHRSFSLEGGVNTGYEYPLSNRMQYFSLINWSPDQWPPVMVFNFDQRGKSAAASRIWTYAVEAMPANQVPEAETGRVVGAFFPLNYLYQAQYFGHRYPSGSDIPKSMKNLFSYYTWLGVNRLTTMDYANQTWGAACTIPSLDAKGTELDAALQELDALGSGKFGYISGFVADGMYGETTSGGVKLKDMPPAQARIAMLKGVGEFIDRYGKYRSLKGMALGSMEATGFYNMLRDQGMAADVVAEIKRRKPDWDVITFLGRPYLQTPYLKDLPLADVISKWLAGRDSWSTLLAEGVRQEWQAGKLNIGLEALKVPGLQVYEMVYPDDYWAARGYHSQPRAPIYLDIERSLEKQALVSSPYAGIFSYFNEGSSGLEAGYNFWYGKRYTGPDVNPAGPLSMAAFALALGAEDRLAISFGSWGPKSIGDEVYLRRFVAAFRSLPPRIMQDVEISGIDTLKVRTVVDGGKRHLSVLNLTSFSHVVMVAGKAVQLDPYELRAFQFDSSSAVSVTANRPQACADWVQNRITQYRQQYETLKRLSAAAAPVRFLEPADHADQLFKQGRLLAADLAIGYGLMNELLYRCDILSPPTVQVPAVPAFDYAQPLAGWPRKCAVVVRDQASDLLGQIFAPNSWQGPDDLSARAQFAHDDGFLYIAINLRDDVCDPEGDDLHVAISKRDYRNFTSEKVPYDHQWKFDLGKIAQGREQNPEGIDIVWQRNEKGYVVGIKLKLPEGIKDRFGLMMYFGDRDKTPNLDTGSKGDTKAWARKQFLGFSGRQNHLFWEDARNCMEVMLAP